MACTQQLRVVHNNKSEIAPCNWMQYTMLGALQILTPNSQTNSGGRKYSHFTRKIF